MKTLYVSICFLQVFDFSIFSFLSLPFQHNWGQHTTSEVVLVIFQTCYNLKSKGFSPLKFMNWFFLSTFDIQIVTGQQNRICLFYLSLYQWPVFTRKGNLAIFRKEKYNKERSKAFVRYEIWLYWNDSKLWSRVVTEMPL